MKNKLQERIDDYFILMRRISLTGHGLTKARQQVHAIWLFQLELEHV